MENIHISYVSLILVGKRYYEIEPKALQKRRDLKEL